MPMDNPQELFYHVDEHDAVLGSVTRAEAHANPLIIHRAVYVLVMSNNNEMLFQKRSKYKDLYPSMWSLSCAGHVTYGKDYRQVAESEADEELGIHPHLFYVTKVLVKTSSESEHCQVYLCKIDHLPERFDRTEIEKLQWVGVNDIPAFVAQNPLPEADMEILRALLYIK